MNAPLLQVNKIGYRNANSFALQNISLKQYKAQKIVVAGETGSGKSTLLRIIAGLVQPNAGTVLLEEELVEGPDYRLVPGHPRIAYLPQHFELPKSLRVEQVLQYANKLSTNEAKKLFRVCRIKPLLKRKTNELSGGERQRIALCRLLIGKPLLLLIDEPYSNLDMIVKNTIRQVMNDISEKLGISIILVSHHPEDTLPWADHIMVLRSGRIVQQGSPAKILTNPKNSYVAGLFGGYLAQKRNEMSKLGLI